MLSFFEQSVVYEFYSKGVVGLFALMGFLFLVFFVLYLWEEIQRRIAQNKVRKEHARRYHEALRQAAEKDAYNKLHTTAFNGKHPKYCDCVKCVAQRFFR